MRIINGTDAQVELLRNLHPEKRVSSYLALVPASEYYFWSRRFTSLLEAIRGFIYPTKISMASKIPIIQCVAKLIGLNSDGFLVPKVFKFGTLPEGTIKDFGLSHQMLPLLDSVASSLDYPTIPPQILCGWNSIQGCLGLMAWDCDNPPIDNGKYLPQFLPCASVARIDDIQIVRNERVSYENREYTHLLPSFNYFPNTKFQRLLQELHDLKLLTLPLNVPFSNLRAMIGFTNPAWAEVKPLEYFLEEDPDKLHKYVLIRTDDGKIVTWSDVEANPKLRLEIEMDKYWLWQEACVTDPSLESINLYWEFGMNYPWLIDKRDNTFVPVFLVDD